MIKGYLVGRVDPTCHEHNDEIADLAEGPKMIQHIFRPHWSNPSDIPHENISIEVTDEDIFRMEQADIGIVALPIGTDCGAEIGWFAGIGKPVVAIIHDWSDPELDRTCVSRINQWESLRRHWMVKAFLTQVIIVGEVLDIHKDPILFDKVKYVENKYDVYNELVTITTKRY